MKLRFAPFWYDRFPHRRRPAYPRYRSELETRVVVVGGGLTGCACACALAAARIPVVLLEASHLGAGATGGSLGLVREDFDTMFAATAAAHGMRAARTLWHGIRRAALEFPSALKRYGVRCDLLPQHLLTVTASAADDTRAFRREYEARRAAGLDHSWVSGANIAREAAMVSGGAIRTRGAALDPYRACIGLAAVASARGAQVFERSEVRRIKSTRKTVEVRTVDGVLRAETVIVAAGTSIADLRPLRRHLHARQTYGVVTEPLTAAARREAGRRAAAIRDSATPPHFVRWLKDDRVLIQGADQDVVPSRGRDQVLIQRTGQLMYELSVLYPAISGTRPAWAWTSGFDETVDGLPFIGPHRNFPHHLFALGLARHGAGAAWLAARILLRHIGGVPAKGDDLFGFARILRAD